MPRSPKLNVAFLAGLPPRATEFLGHSAWQEIEAAYGHQISERVRIEITEATQKLIEFSEFALAAQPISTSLERAETIKRSAANLLEVLCSRPETTITIDTIIEKQLAALGCTLPYTLDGISDALSCLIAASEKSRRQLAERAPSGLRADEHWRHWIRRISRIVKVCGLPTAVRKDRDGDPAWKPSAFVLLIDSIQKCLPQSITGAGGKNPSRKSLSLRQSLRQDRNLNVSKIRENRDAF
jgi:hypothetical protein